MEITNAEYTAQAEFASSWPTSEFLSRLSPKALVSVYMDVVDSYEWVKSENCKTAARAQFGGQIRCLEAAMQELGLEYSDVDADDAGRPTGAKVERLQHEWYEANRG